MHAFRQLEERGLSVEVSHMKWSPCMDLIALANIQGEVCVILSPCDVCVLIMWCLHADHVIIVMYACWSCDHVFTPFKWSPSVDLIALANIQGEVARCRIITMWCIRADHVMSACWSGDVCMLIMSCLHADHVISANWSCVYTTWNCCHVWTWFTYQKY